MSNKENKNKLKHSNFQLCISLNKTQPSKEEIERFRKSLEECFSEENVKNVILADDKDMFEQSSTRCVIKHAIELAPEDNKLHSHSLIAITHRTKVKLDMNLIRNMMAKSNNLDYIPYVMAKVSGGSEKGAIQGFLEYVNKIDSNMSE